ncbi:MAG: glycosyltransferase [Methylomarinum sp.]|nr:glycosyltransferase [Methylomarinum sp.]
MMQRVVWINKSNWRKPGPIVYMGLLNAMAFAQHKIETDYFVGYGSESDTDQDLVHFYGINVSSFLHIHRIKENDSGRREVYRKAVLTINQYLSNGDEVIALTRELGALSELLKIKKKNPQLQVLYESHDYYLNRTHLPKQGFSAIRRQWAERILIPKADALICLTEHQRALYQQQLTQLPILVAPLGCLDFPKQDSEQRRIKRNVAYIGHVHSYKGSDLIFELAKELKLKNITLSCYGGNEPQIVELRSKSQKQGLDDVLKFEPFMSPVDLHRILDLEVSIGLVPLQDTFYSRYLTCPVKALDFLSHGLPIVASELPSIREVLQHTGHYCSSKDASQFAQVIEALLENSLAYQVASQDSYQRNVTLQWYLRAEKILQLCA